MTFDLNTLLAALALLWLPLPAAIGRVRRYRGRTPNATVGGILRTWQFWLDVGRGAAGTWLLLDRAIQIEPPANPSHRFYAQAAVLLVGVLVQTVRFGPGLCILGPVGFLTGITLVLPGLKVGGLAVAFAWALTLGTREPRCVLPALGGMVFLAGFFWEGFRLPVALTAGLAFVPLFLSAVLGKTQTFVSRESRWLREPASGPVLPAEAVLKSESVPAPAAEPAASASARKAASKGKSDPKVKAALL